MNSLVDLTALPSGADTFTGGLQLFGDGRPFPSDPMLQMRLAQFSHESLPHGGATFLQELRPNAKLLGRRSVAPSPGPKLGKIGTRAIALSVKL